MHPKLQNSKVVIASHNRGKVREIGELLEPLGLSVISAGELNLPEPEETEDTFVGNATLKAEAAAEASDLPALADDSGVCVHALNNEPGIYSARWAGPNRDFMVAMNRVNESLQGKENKGLHFVCCLALAIPGEETVHFEGRIDGTFAWPPRGKNGFGYDPIFVPEGHNITFGEMDPAKKHGMSHRARAFSLFLDWLNKPAG